MGTSGLTYDDFQPKILSSKLIAYYEPQVHKYIWTVLKPHLAFLALSANILASLKADIGSREISFELQAKAS